MTRSPSSTLFPYTTLFRSIGCSVGKLAVTVVSPTPDGPVRLERKAERPAAANRDNTDKVFRLYREDRKSTRLNSSHMSISYAVFCLKKKNNCHHRQNTATH